MEVAAMVGVPTSPRLERAVATSPVGWTIGVELKKASFWLVAVPILVPVVVSVIKLLAERVSPPPLTVKPPVAEATVIFPVPSKETPPMVRAFCKAVAVPAFPEIVVWSPVFVPETDTAPAPIVRTEVLAAFPVSVTVPVLTVSAVVKVAPVT